VTPAISVVDLRGGTVRLEVRSAGRGPALLWLHSILDRDPWPPLLDALAERHTVYAPSHPGVAGSTGVETLDDVVDLALVYDELLGALGVATAILGGHFFGAMMAAELAALCPARAQRVCLVSPLGLWLTGKPVADVLILPVSELEPLLWTDPSGAAARRWATLAASSVDNAAAEADQIQQLAVMGKFVWPIPDKGLRKRLHRIAAPTELVWGDGDRVNPLAYAEEFRRLIPGAAVHRVTGGHMLHLEQPELVAAHVTGRGPAGGGRG
jgi:pimeloyl-ACP methyl ester carboxylesterase